MKYQSFKTIFIALLFVVVLNGCIGSLPLQKNLSIPSWYLNAPANNSLFIYGEGISAISLVDAKNNALNTMASKLVVNVGSSISSRTQSSGNSYSKDVIQNIKVEVEKIKFTNPHLEKSVHINNNFYVLMSVDRRELFKNKKREFDLLDTQIESKYQQSHHYSKLEQIYTLQNLNLKIKKAKQKAVVLNAISNDFDHTEFIEKYDAYLNKIDTLKEQMVIKIDSNHKKRYFKDTFISLLNKNGYKTSDAFKSDVEMFLENKIKYSVARGWNIAKVSTTISVSVNGKTISNTIFNSLGRSSTSQQSALENASKDFNEQIKHRVLDKVIFNK